MKTLAVIPPTLGALLAVASGQAFAQSPEPEQSVLSKAASTKLEAPTQAISVSLPALSVRAVALAYEHHGLAPILDKRFSLQVIVGGRAAATDDYSSATGSLGLGIRYWLTGRAPWSRYTEPGMLGAFVGLRVGLAYTNIRDDIDDERIGAAVVLSETAELGYRFAAWGRLEITPSLGFQVRHEFDLVNRLPGWTRTGVGIGLTAGYLF